MRANTHSRLSISKTIFVFVKLMQNLQLYKLYELINYRVALHVYKD